MAAICIPAQAVCSPFRSQLPLRSSVPGICCCALEKPVFAKIAWPGPRTSAPSAKTSSSSRYPDTVPSPTRRFADWPDWSVWQWAVWSRAAQRQVGNSLPKPTKPDVELLASHAHYPCEETFALRRGVFSPVLILFSTSRMTRAARACRCSPRKLTACK
jgi:hypothetical protein